MKLGEYAVKKLIGGVSFVAAVQVEILEAAHQKREPIMDFAGRHWDSLSERDAYKAAASFGAFYALEKLHNSELVSAIEMARFLQIKGYVVDTTMPIVAMAACLAVWHALGVSGNRRPFIDEDNKSVCFPK